MIEKLHEELGELRKRNLRSGASRSRMKSAMLLFAAVNLARFLKVDPEIALKRTNAKFTSRFREMERLARDSGRKLADVPREEMESLWDQAKLLERRKRNRHRPSKAATK